MHVQLYKKSRKKHSIMKLYKYSPETKAKVQEYRYHQNQLVRQAASSVDHKWHRWVLLILLY